MQVGLQAAGRPLAMRFHPEREARRPWRSSRAVLAGVVATAALTVVGGGRAAAAVLVADDFNSVAAGAGIHNRLAPTNNGNAWQANATNIVGNGAGGLSGNSANASVALVDLGAGYVSANPGVYSASVDINQPSGVGSSSWLALGFAQGAALDQNFVADNGSPWVLFRLNGQEVVFAGPSNTNTLLSSANGAVSLGVAHTFRLDLDTTAAAWTVNGYLDGVQQDLNGAAAGNTYTYAANPTAARYVGFSTGNNGTGALGTFDNFLATGPVPVPEPAVGSVTLLGAGLLAGRRAGRRRDR